MSIWPGWDSGGGLLGSRLADGPLPRASVSPLGERCECRVRFPQQVKPLIWIESVIEKHSHSRIEYMIKVRAHPAPNVNLGTRAVREGAVGSLAGSGLAIQA